MVDTNDILEYRIKMNLFADIKTPIFAPNLPLKEYKRYN